MHEGAPLAVGAVMLGSMELFAELCLVVLRDIDAVLQFVPSVSKGALKFIIIRIKVHSTDKAADN